VDTTGDAAFANWAAGQAPGLHRFAYLLCGDWHDAEDLVQEALAKAALHWKRIERVEHPDAYVRTILVNQCRSMWRRPWRRAKVSEPVELSTPDQTDAIASHTDLVAALQRLPVRQRATVVLRYYEDLSEAETAAVLGCSVGTVKSQHHKALQALRVTMVKEGLRC
jgi:RNA polymerase sigma-70 factor (sigma-E family)